jgi:GT2 family glycosyltransferase
LRALAASADFAGVAAAAVLVDDGSTDGTAEAVRAEFPWVRVVPSPGQLFWNRGMHRALAVAQAESADAVLWLNDDTRLHQAALQQLLAQADDLRRRLGRPAIVVGSTCDGAGRRSYGGAVAASRLRRFKYRPVWDAGSSLPCEVMNGNCVLVPMPVAHALGNVDPAFEHAMGDTDYALRARAAGHGVYVAAGFVGVCDQNGVAGTFLDAGLPLRRRWALMMDRKGLPWRSWLHFTRRHGGWLWPAYFAWPYLRLVGASLAGRS